MADIISLNDKFQLAEERRAARDRRRKIRAVQKVFQCSRCAFKCEKCGSQLECDCKGLGTSQSSVPYHFCESCSEEYQEYVECLQGGGDPACYWQNDAWLATWKQWIDYQSAKENYIKSPEFVRLIQEMRQIGPEE